MRDINSKIHSRKLRYGSNQFRYAVIYVVLTFIVLVFLNYYTSDASQTVFYRSKHAALVDKILLVSAAVGEQEVLNADTAASAIASLGDLNVARLIVTDAAGRMIYDSHSVMTGDELCLFPEVVQALLGNDVIAIDYHDGMMVCRAAAPILSRNTLTGCAYILEYDAEQGQLIWMLQNNVLTVTVLLIAVIVVFSIIFGRIFTVRLRRIMESMRIIREGNYAHKVKMGGHDELTALGISDASHELKTPLASIKLLSDSILQNDMDLDTVREFVSDIGDEADRLTRMSEKLLSLTRFHPDEGSDCEITYFRPTIERVLRMLSTTADMAYVTLSADIREDASILILEDDLYQIIFNLAENGIKYNVPDGTLTVRLRREEDNAVLTISDTGMGIPTESLGKIFDRFYRVDKARSRQTGGSGLGLAIVKEMVERNRGSITVTSSDVPPTGTTFTLTFPVFDVEEL